MCLSSLPRTNLDHEDLLTHYRVALRQGGTLPAVGQYLWDLALVLEGCASENEYRSQWSNHGIEAAKMSKTLSDVLRHSPTVTYDSEGFVRISDIMCNNPKARF